jgi:hypothetical protein
MVSIATLSMNRTGKPIVIPEKPAESWEVLARPRYYQPDLAANLHRFTRIGENPWLFTLL